jgi:DNA repair ATPase RecN
MSQDNAPVPNVSPMIQMSNMVQQLDDIIKFALECEKKTNVKVFNFPKAQEQIAQIQSQLQLLNEAYKRTLDELGITDADLETYRKRIQESSGPEKKLFSHIEKLQKICQESRDRIYNTLQANAEVVKKMKAETASDKKKMKTRKGKFKSVGGKKGWVPT